MAAARTYAETEVLHEGQRTRVVRAVADDGTRVVCKQLRTPWPTPAELGRLQREHDLLLELGGESVPRVLRLEIGDVAQLVLEDVGAVSLARWLSGARPGAVEALEVAVGMARALAAVHARDVVHRDVNPSNVLVDAATRRAWIIDFDLAMVLQGRSATLPVPGALTGTAPYIAPEQTGWMNRPIDARADLYSLGVTLYELLAGTLPFAGDDVLALAHAHLTRDPPLLVPAVPGLPDGAAELVRLLMSKRPEDRYQSAPGLVLDLERLLASARGGSPALLAHRTVSERLELPGDLQGRSRELARLAEAFDEAARGRCRVLLVSGEAGIGKTSLVRELHRPVAIGGGRLLEGKVGQFTRETPYAALSQVLAAFVSDVLALPTSELDGWRERFARLTAPNTGLLVDLVPSLEVLVGRQAPLGELPPREAERRIHDTLRRAVEAMARIDAPLVVFLDDLQWADLPSLRALESIFGDRTLRHVLLVGAFREEEANVEQLLAPTIAAIAEGGNLVERVRLGPLSRDDVRVVVARTLRREPDQVGPLADVLLRLSGGNPFFLRHLMGRAHEAGAIRAAPGASAWDFDVPGVEALGVSENVVTLLQKEIGSLSGEARRTLCAAALLPDAFGVRELSIATGLQPSRVRPALNASIWKGFVRPLDAEWWAQASDPDHAFRFAFVHDKVQQAAGALLHADERAALHLALARGSTPRSESAPFEIAEHYLAARDGVTDPDERIAMVRVLLEAGQRALHNAAHAPAYRYLEAGVDSGERLWDSDPDAAWRLWVLAAQAAFVSDHPERIEDHVRVLRARARHPIERLQAEEAVIQARIARTDLHGALDTALHVLEQAGVRLPRRPADAAVAAAVGEALAALAGRDLESVAAVQCRDPLELASRRLLVHIASASYVAEPNLLPLIACELVTRTIAAGASSESAYGFALFGLCLCAAWHLAPGSAMDDIARGLLERYPDKRLEGSIRHVADYYLRIWNDPLREVHDGAPDITRSLLAAGDHEYAGWSQHLWVVYGFFSGVPLDVLAGEIDAAVGFMRRHEVLAALHCTLPFEHLVKALRGETGSPTRLSGADYDEAAAFDAHTSTSFRAAALVLSVCRLTARVLGRDVAGAAAVANDVMELRDGAVGIFYQCPMRVLAAIARLDASADPALDVEAVLPWRDPLAACAERNPGSGAHLLALFDAEVARARGDVALAIARYDEAILSASRNGFVHDEALAYERAGEMHRSRGTLRIALAYLAEARACWQRWGATAHVERMDATYPELRIRRGSRPATHAEPGDGSIPQATLDLESVLKAAHAIAEEVQLDSLLTRSMKVVLESVGARRGALFLVRRGELETAVTGDAGGDVSLQRGARMETAPFGSPAVARRVFRSGKAEVHDRVPEADGGEVRSMLCVPVTWQRRTLGVLHVENDVEGGFSPARIRMLEVLASQLAISVRNAMRDEAQGRFLPTEFLRSLERHDIVDVEVGDHRLKEVSIFFSDIWGFTPLVEKLPAAEALAFINRYLFFAEPAIKGAGGFIDTYLGDGIMALFDDPAASASNAVAAAVAVHQALDRFNAERRRKGLLEVRTGVGINTGVVTLATIGGQQSLKCGVVGDAVNLASRVEGLTRRYDSRVLLSDATARRLDDRGGLTLRRAGRVLVKGREQPVTLFEVLDAEPPDVLAARTATLATFEAALDAYWGRDIVRAREGFAECLGRAPGDRQARRYLDRVLEMGDAGPPAGWDGVERAR